MRRAMRLQALREEVAVLHHELPRRNLVAWTSGNLSGRDAASGLIVIKPTGLKYEDLTPESMVVVNTEGRIVEGDHKPSSDTASHCYIYREMPEVHGIVHTHSAYATAWAAVGRAIPCFLTAMADEFGGPIPCGASPRSGAKRLARRWSGCSKSTLLPQS
jgi:L-ribulose-5-phosphate 4-epimerase